MLSRFLLFIAVIVAAVAVPRTVTAQELICDVQLNTNNISTENDIFTELQESIKSYMNDTKFSSAQIATNERINCRLNINIQEVKDGTIKCDIQIQSSRPVYNSSYPTTVLNYHDTKVSFPFESGQRLNHVENDWDSDLTALLDYYAYLVLAMDFDSFAPRGGQPFWDIVNNIVQLAQSQDAEGWKSFGDTKNRAAVLAAFTQPSTAELRDLNYAYHRKGLDEMTVSPDKGRAAITQSLDILDKVHKVSPMSVGLTLFEDAKFDEIVNIYTKSSDTERKTLYDLMRKLYPTETQKLEMLKNGTNKVNN